MKQNKLILVFIFILSRAGAQQVMDNHSTNADSDAPEITVTDKTGRRSKTNRSLGKTVNKISRSFSVIKENKRDIAVQTGYSYMGYINFWEKDELENSDVLNSVTGLHGLNCSFIFSGKNYITMQMSPRWNANKCLFLNLETGTSRHISEFFSYAIFFLGRLISFKDSILTTRGTSPDGLQIAFQETDVKVARYNGGLGIMLAGMGVAGNLSLEYRDIFFIKLGLYFSMTAIMPKHAAMAIGVNGPDIKYYPKPEKFGFFLHIRPMKWLMDMNYFSWGIIYHFGK